MSKFGCPSEPKTLRSATPGTVRMTCSICRARASSFSRSSPKSLIEFSPLTPDMAHHGGHLWVLGEYMPHLINELGRLAVGDGFRHRCPHPEVTLFQLGHKFSTDERQRRQRCRQGQDSDHDGDAWMRQYATQQRCVHPPDRSDYPGLLLLVARCEDQGGHDR